MSGSLGFGVDHLSELGLRLLAIDRPGLGRSTPHPTKTLTTWTDDVRWLVEHRGLGQIATAGVLSRRTDEGFARGSEGYARDLLNTLGPWPVPAEQISAPVDLWYGQLDTSPVHSPDFGQALLQRLPDARHHLLPDEGGSILWTRSKEILQGIRELIHWAAPQR